MPKLIDIECLEPGMVIVKSIINRFGQLILPEGTKIEERHKRVLKTWGVKSLMIVDITDNSNDIEPEPDDRIKTLAEEYLKKKIRWTPRNGYEVSMYQIALKRTVDKFNRRQNEHH